MDKLVAKLFCPKQTCGSNCGSSSCGRGADGPSHKGVRFNNVIFTCVSLLSYEHQENSPHLEASNGLEGQAVFYREE